MRKLTTDKQLSRNQMFRVMSKTDDPEKTLEDATRFIKALQKYAPDMKDSAQAHHSVLQSTIAKKRVKKKVCTDDV